MDLLVIRCSVRVLYLPCQVKVVAFHDIPPEFWALPLTTFNGYGTLHYRHPYDNSKNRKQSLA
jgi:hypothetical protein